jgi:hypothetical protein
MTFLSFFAALLRETQSRRERHHLIATKGVGRLEWRNASWLVRVWRGQPFVWLSFSDGTAGTYDFCLKVRAYKYTSWNRRWAFDSPKQDFVL